MAEQLLLLGGPRCVSQLVRGPCEVVMPMGCWLQPSRGRVLFILGVTVWGLGPAGALLL